MEIRRWEGPYKVTAFPWIDGKHIYFNVLYYVPGQSIEKPPAWDKTVYITNDAAGRQLVFKITNTLIEYVATMKIGGNIQANIAVEHIPKLLG